MKRMVILCSFHGFSIIQTYLNHWPVSKRCGHRPKWQGPTTTDSANDEYRMYLMYIFQYVQACLYLPILLALEGLHLKVLWPIRHQSLLREGTLSIQWIQTTRTYTSHICRWTLIRIYLHSSIFDSYQFELGGHWLMPYFYIVQYIIHMSDLYR